MNVINGGDYVFIRWVCGAEFETLYLHNRAKETTNGHLLEMLQNIVVVK